MKIDWPKWFIIIYLFVTWTCGVYGFAVHRTMVDAFHSGVAVPEVIDAGKWGEHIKYRWVDPHLLEEIPPPLPEETEEEIVLPTCSIGISRGTMTTE